MKIEVESVCGDVDGFFRRGSISAEGTNERLHDILMWRESINMEPKESVGPFEFYY